MINGVIVLMVMLVTFFCLPLLSIYRRNRGAAKFSFNKGELFWLAAYTVIGLRTIRVFALHLRMRGLL